MYVGGRPGGSEEGTETVAAIDGGQEKTSGAI